MDIRPLATTDAALFQALRLRGLQEYPTAFSSSFEEERDLAIAVIAERLVPATDRVVFGAFRDGTLAGVVGLNREDHRKLAHKAFLWGMYVAPEFRRRGVGRALVERVLQHAGELTGLRQVTLGVNAANDAAVALYEGFGFEPFGLERGFMLLDGVLYDEIHMVRRLAR